MTGNAASQLNRKAYREMTCRYAMGTSSRGTCWMIACDGAM